MELKTAKQKKAYWSLPEADRIKIKVNHDNDCPIKLYGIGVGDKALAPNFTPLTGAGLFDHRGKR
jgi:hypothetical protein